MGETTTTVPMSLNDVLKEIPSMVSMEDTDGNILSGEQNVKYSVTKIENRFLLPFLPSGSLFIRPVKSE